MWLRVCTEVCTNNTVLLADGKIVSWGVPFFTHLRKHAREPQVPAFVTNCIRSTVRKDVAHDAENGKASGDVAKNAKDEDAEEDEGDAKDDSEDTVAGVEDNTENEAEEVAHDVEDVAEDLGFRQCMSAGRKRMRFRESTSCVNRRALAARVSAAPRQRRRNHPCRDAVSIRRCQKDSFRWHQSLQKQTFHGRCINSDFE